MAKLNLFKEASKSTAYKKAKRAAESAAKKAATAWDKAVRAAKKKVKKSNKRKR